MIVLKLFTDRKETGEIKFRDEEIFFRTHDFPLKWVADDPENKHFKITFEDDEEVKDENFSKVTGE